MEISYDLRFDTWNNACSNAVPSPSSSMSLYLHERLARYIVSVLKMKIEESELELTIRTRHHFISSVCGGRQAQSDLGWKHVASMAVIKL